MLCRGALPLRAPIRPGLDARGGAHEIVVVDPLGDEPRRPVSDRRLDPWIAHAGTTVSCQGNESRHSRPVGVTRNVWPKNMPSVPSAVERGWARTSTPPRLWASPYPSPAQGSG